jgi:hypothetical protein
MGKAQVYRQKKAGSQGLIISVEGLVIVYIFHL